jgi:hypothetical protein
MKTIPLTQNKFALIDDEDFEKLSSMKWHARKIGNKFYAGSGKYLGKINGKYKTVNIHMHHFILGIEKIDCNKIQIDHKNGNGLDNRKENLRIATPSQNRRNLSILKRNNTSGYRGVTKRGDAKKDSWRARIYLPNGKRKTIGHFKSAKQAALAFDKAARELYGEFCGKLNFKTIGE